jgi:hypothetical protein
MICRFREALSGQIPYVLDLHLFLGRPLITPSKQSIDTDGVFGCFPSSLLHSEIESLQSLHDRLSDLADIHQVASNAYKQYHRSMSAPSAESVRRHKEMAKSGLKLQTHPMLVEMVDKDDKLRIGVLEGVKQYRPAMTIFEVNCKAKALAVDVMKSKRKHHDSLIAAVTQKRQKQVPDAAISVKKPNQEEQPEAYQQQPLIAALLGRGFPCFRNHMTNQHTTI